MALAPPGESTPLSCERAPEPLSGSRTRSMLVTTSSAPKGLPSLNVTPERSLKVHTSTASFGVQLSASLPRSELSSLRSMRYSRN